MKSSFKFGQITLLLVATLLLTSCQKETSPDRKTEPRQSTGTSAEKTTDIAGGPSSMQQTDSTATSFEDHMPAIEKPSDGAVEASVEEVVSGRSVRIRFRNRSDRPLIIRDDPEAYYLLLQEDGQWVELELDEEPSMLLDIGVPALEPGQSKTVDFNLGRYEDYLNEGRTYRMVIGYSYADHDLKTGPAIALSLFCIVLYSALLPCR